MTKMVCSIYYIDDNVDYFISFKVADGHHDLSLVTLFLVTELDLFCHDPDGMLNDLKIQ